MDFFNYHDHKVVPQKGDLLISEPFLPDPNFVRTVVLLCEHNEQGSFGFVLNRQANVVLSELSEDLEDIEANVFIGGPVEQNTLHFIHSRGTEIENSIEVSKGLYWGGDFKQLIFLLKNNLIKTNDFKFFVGYSGWGEGQLQHELEQNSWIISRNVNVQQVLHSDSEKYWKQVLSDMGGKYRVISNYPVDPRLN